MERLTLVVLCAFALSVSIVSGEKIDLTDLDNLINKTNYMLVMYDQNLDSVVPFKAFNASLAALDIMSQDYKGKCHQDIYDACHMGYRASDQYYRATDQIFRWCSVANKLVSYSLKHVEDKKFLFTAMLKVTSQGIDTITKSLVSLEEVRTELTNMKAKLQPIPKNLEDELEELRRSADRTVNKILEIAGGPAGYALGLFSALIAKGIELVIIQGRLKPSQSKKFKITETYYANLIEAVKNANGNVTAVKNALNQEITLVTGLQGDVSAHQEIIQMLMDTEMYRPDALEGLLVTVNGYIERHGGNVGNSPVRAIRDVTIPSHDVDAIVAAVNYALDQTAREREENYWKLPNPSIPMLVNPIKVPIMLNYGI